MNKEKNILILLLLMGTLGYAQSVRVSISSDFYLSPLQKHFENRLSEYGFGDTSASPFNQSINILYPFSKVRPSLIFAFERLIDEKNSFGFKVGVIGRGNTVGYSESDNLYLDVNYYSFLFDISYRRYFGNHQLELSAGFVEFNQEYRDLSLKSVAYVRPVGNIAYHYEILITEGLAVTPFVSFRLIQNANLGPFRIAGHSDEIIFENKMLHQLAFGLSVTGLVSND